MVLSVMVLSWVKSIWFDLFGKQEGQKYLASHRSYGQVNRRIDQDQLSHRSYGQVDRRIDQDQLSMLIKSRHAT